MSMKSIPITIMFAAITLSQLSVEIVLISIQATEGGKPEVLPGCAIIDRVLHPTRASEAQKLPPIPVDAFHLCSYHRHRRMELAFNTLSLLYGVLEIPRIETNGYSLVQKFVYSRHSRILVDDLLCNAGETIGG